MLLKSSALEADGFATVSCGTRSCSRPSVPSAPHNWPLLKPVNKAPSFTTMASIACHSNLRDFAVGSRHRRPYPAGSRARGWGDGSVPRSIVLSHNPRAFVLTRTAARVFFLLKKNLGQTRAPVSESQTRRRPRLVFGRGLSSQESCFSLDRILAGLYTHVSYPAPTCCCRSSLDPLSDNNLRILPGS